MQNTPSTFLRIHISIIFLFIFGLLYLSSLISTIVGRSPNNLLFLILIGFAIVFGLIRHKSRKVVLLVCIYLLFLLVSMTFAVKNDISFGCTLKQMLYYLKPLAFFLVGYWFLSRKHIDGFMKLLLLYMALGTVYAIFNSDGLVGLANRKLVAMGYKAHENEYHMWVFNPVFVGLFKYLWVTEGGFILRNPTLVFSPLESGFILAFLSSYFYYMSHRVSKVNRWLFYLCTAMLMSTMVRSAWLFFTVAYITYRILFTPRKWRLILGVAILIIATLFVAVFAKELRYIFSEEKSAEIHTGNLIEVMEHINKHVAGAGLGSAGWQGDISSPLYVYSEGSIFSSIVEIGIQFLLVYIVLFLILYKRSKDFLLPLYLGYLTAALVIPIGFSTYFNLLFFTTLGTVLREQWKKTNGLSRDEIFQPRQDHGYRATKASIRVLA